MSFKILISDHLHQFWTAKLSKYEYGTCVSKVVCINMNATLMNIKQLFLFCRIVANITTVYYKYRNHSILVLVNYSNAYTSLSLFYGGQAYSVVIFLNVYIKIYMYYVSLKKYVNKCKRIC